MWLLLLSQPEIEFPHTETREKVRSYGAAAISVGLIDGRVRLDIRTSINIEACSTQVVNSKDVNAQSEEASHFITLKALRLQLSLS